ncbi:MAG: GNAT family N-acetyltransferase [Anaerolineae bacterium]
MKVRPLTPEDQTKVGQFIRERWQAESVVAHGVVYHPHQLPGFVCEADGRWLGLLTYHLAGDACEIVTLDSVEEGQGVGTALVTAVQEMARRAGHGRLWLITTNDNLNALRFYQKRGFRLTAVHINAIAKSRQLKPGIPLFGSDGIPIRDEIELELSLDN